MHSYHAKTAADNLHGHVGGRRLAIEIAAQQHHEAHRRIEVGARQRHEGRDEDEENCAYWNGVAE